MTRTIAILVFPDAETLDYAGPYEVFAVASEIANAPLFDLKLVASEAGIVNGRYGFQVNAVAGYADVRRPDILLVPGGYGTRAVVEDSATIDWIQCCAHKAELVLSVCTGSFLLAEAGLLDGIPCTTHRQSIERMRKAYPNIEVRENVRYVDNGRVVTSAGVSAGIDMSLHIVRRLHGDQHARKTARVMEYHWAADQEIR